ncbi:DUF5631 domain-containing protein [Mycobacterium canetti]|uniref:DUF5631 domain-containing protein n=1 Tax=Mycobacterium canetti TaxID=78331 RepID=UPI0032E3DA5B
MADLPPGKWSALLVGAWWPARPDAPMAGVTYWREAAQLKRTETNDLRNERSRLAVNQGRTADDLLERYWRGEQRLATIAHQCEVKSDQSDRVADAVHHLRDRLTDIAQSGNQQIDQILAGKGPMEAKVAAVNAVIERSNIDAANAGRTAMSNIIDATQRVLDETIGGDAQTWLRDHGVSLDDPPRPRPITAEDLDSPPTASPGESTVGGGRRPLSASSPGGGAPVMSQAEPTVGGERKPPLTPSPACGAAAVSSVGPTVGGSRRLPAPPPPGTVSPPLPPSTPTVGVGGPSVPATGMPAAAASAPLSPQSLGQSFTSGMTTGAPAAAGAQSLSSGVVHAATEPLPPPVPPPATPTMTTPTVATAATAGVAHIPDSAAAPSPAPVAPPTPAPETGNAITPLTPMVTAASPTASPALPTATPPGPLPAYGADLRPPIATPPATPLTPTGPVSGAAVAPSSPAAGGSLMSPVVKSTTPATTQAQPSSPTPPLTSATAAATTGAVAGDTSHRAAEQQRLRRILDTVARQEPALSWAAGLRDNGQTTLLVTDLADGWIPPHIRLPAHITLLEPAPRRRHATVTDLLGATTVAATHHPHGYLGEPDPDTPALTGDRTARITARIDELGPTLVETVRRRDTLPRIAQTIAVAATRNYGVPDNETDLLHHKTTEIHQAVLTTYPNHDIATVVDWMLLAAINALIAGDQSGANYHLTWAIAATSTRRSR